MDAAMDETKALRRTEIERQTLDPATLRITRGPLGEFRCEVRDECCYMNFRASRCFPLSDRQHYIALFDGLKGEIGVIQDMSSLDAESRSILGEMLDRRYFLPVITHVKSIREEFGVVYWSVETTVGPRDFVCRGMRDSVASLSERRLLITDADGNRFEIADYMSLSRSAQSILDRVL